MPALALSGTCCSTVSSRSSFPSSRRAITSTAVNVLVFEAMRNWVSSVGGWSGLAMSAAPTPSLHTSRTPRATPAAMPGTRPSLWRCPIARRRWRDVDLEIRLMITTLSRGSWVTGSLARRHDRAHRRECTLLGDREVEASVRDRLDDGDQDATGGSDGPQHLVAGMLEEEGRRYRPQGGGDTPAQTEGREVPPPMSCRCKGADHGEHVAGEQDLADPADHGRDHETGHVVRLAVAGEAHCE